jgi:ribosomal protein S7
MIKSSYITKLSKLLIIGGGKQRSEGIVIKCFKKLQRKSIKQPYELLQTTVKHLTPVFRLQTLTSKKRRKPTDKLKKKTSFVLNPSYRLTLAIKCVIDVIKNRKSVKTCDKLIDEIMSTCDLSSQTIQKTLNDQKQVLLYKKSTKIIKKNYRWKNSSNRKSYV